jgi:hypothetical protein
MTRNISDIASDIRTNWKKPYFGAVPYIRAMSEFSGVTDNYYLDPAREILTYFLANATTWRGDKAREIKAEIKSILNGRK